VWGHKFASGKLAATPAFEEALQVWLCQTCSPSLKRRACGRVQKQLGAHEYA